MKNVMPAVGMLVCLTRVEVGVVVMGDEVLIVSISLDVCKGWLVLLSAFAFSKSTGDTGSSGDTVPLLRGVVALDMATLWKEAATEKGCYSKWSVLLVLMSTSYTHILPKAPCKGWKVDIGMAFGYDTTDINA
jgi:hypothetical protein